MSYSGHSELDVKVSEDCKRLLSPAAEVQAHASLQSRADLEQLREQLLNAFRQQMDIRKSLMELENSNIEIQIDKSKHLLIITESLF